MASQPIAHFTPEQYLEIERAAGFRSEYLNGEMFAMAGATARHNEIVNAIGRTLYPQIKQRCRYFTTDMRLLIPATGLYTYPDLLVICAPIAFAGDRGDMVTNPSFIVEVLSSTTADYDRGRKFEHYRSIPTLVDYLAVAQDKVHVEHYNRCSDGSWSLRDYDALVDLIQIPAIEAGLLLADIYEGQVFQP
jgi:Uma2 family endonuclease